VVIVRHGLRHGPVPISEAWGVLKFETRGAAAINDYVPPNGVMVSRAPVIIRDLVARPTADGDHLEGQNVRIRWVHAWSRYIAPAAHAVAGPGSGKLAEPALRSIRSRTERPFHGFRPTTA